jgi:hypothetical protein
MSSRFVNVYVVGRDDNIRRQHTLLLNVQLESCFVSEKSDVNGRRRAKTTIWLNTTVF